MLLCLLTKILFSDGFLTTERIQKRKCERIIKKNGKVFSDDLWEKAKIKDKFNYALVILF